MNNEISFSFIERLSSAEKMGVREQDNLTLVVPEQCRLSSNQSYQSPYQLRFSFNWSDLVACLDQQPYCKWSQEGNPDYFPDDARWLDPHVYIADPEEVKVVDTLHWGPEPRHYPTLPLIKEKSHKWKAERLVAVAASMIGYGYHHHHIPDWNPSKDGIKSYLKIPTPTLMNLYSRKYYASMRGKALIAATIPLGSTTRH